MIYLLARQFSPNIAFPCTLSLTFMTYHISLSQDGRSYALLMFLGITGLYFFMKHLKTSRKRYLFIVAFLFSLLFYTSYSSIPFIALSQIFWFYRPTEEDKKPNVSSFLILNGLILLLCLPWIIFVATHYKGQAVMDPFHTESPGSFWYILYCVLHDWTLHVPLLILSVILLLLFPIFSRSRKNALILLLVFILPIAALSLFCNFLNLSHFISSRYFINFLPLFFITLYLSLDSIEMKFERLKTSLRLKLFFVIIFIASNLVILPLYYRSEKQDVKGLVTYLKGQLRNGDKIFIGAAGSIPAILHYFGLHPERRHHIMRITMDSGKIIKVQKSFIYRDKILTILFSKTCCAEYVADGSRVWIIVDKWMAKQLKETSPCVLKGYFDGSFLNFNRFPTDASMYLLLWDPYSPEEKGIDLPIE